MPWRLQRKRRVVAAFVTCGLFALAASPAVAAKKAKKPPPKLGPIVTATAVGNSPIAPSKVSTATAACPAGTFALGGGFSGPVTDANAVVVVSSYRSSLTTWTVTGQVVSGSAAVTAYAYCRRAKKRTVRTASASAAFLPLSQNVQTVTATCPPGWKRISGGFRTTTGPASNDIVLTQTSVPTVQGWHVTGYNVNPIALQITVEAYCLNKIERPFQDIKSQRGPASQTVPVSATAACIVKKQTKNGKKTAAALRRLTAGAFQTPTSFAPSAIPFVTESRISGAGWISSVLAANNPPGSLLAVSYAICF